MPAVVTWEKFREELEQSLRSIAEKTVEAVRVEEMPKQIFEQYSIDAGFNKAVKSQNTKASAWLGKE